MALVCSAEKNVIVVNTVIKTAVTDTIINTALTDTVINTRVQEAFSERCCILAIYTENTL
jgi:hypothetical protein